MVPIFDKCTFRCLLKLAPTISAKWCKDYGISIEMNILTRFPVDNLSGLSSPSFSVANKVSIGAAL